MPPEPNDAAPAPAPPVPSLGDRVVNAGAQWLIDRALRLPWDERVPHMGRVVRRWVGPLAGYRRRALANLALIWPDLPLADRQRIAAGALDNVGRTLIENYSYRDFGAHLRGATVSGPGLALVAAAQAAGQPVLFVTGHFGNHEAPRHILAAQGHAVGGLYRPMKNALFNDRYARTMTDWSGPVFEQGRRGTLGFARHLRQGGMATLLFDVWNREGISLPFLGRDARTSTAAADLALKYQALVIPYFGIRQPDGMTFDCAFEAPIPHGTTEAMMDEMTARLEARVTAHPDQWFWVHRRWKS